MKFIDSESKDGDIWFDCNGTPLKWHFPVGVLFELTAKDKDNLPWMLTIHFSKFPDGMLIRCPNKYKYIYEVVD